MRYKKYLKKIKKIIIFICLLLSLLCGCGSAAQWENIYQSEAADLQTEEQNTKEQGAANTGTEESLDDQTFVQVHVCGAVVNPGVYELPNDARVKQAIDAAGGMTEEADELLLNQARIVKDGEQIRVYTKEEALNIGAMQSAEGETADAADGKININYADDSVLMTLPGIGEAKAAAIIAYRESNGAFASIEEIMNIPGIKDAVFSQIKDKITV